MAEKNGAGQGVSRAPTHLMMIFTHLAANIAQEALSREISQNDYRPIGRIIAIGKTPALIRVDDLVFWTE